jgi:dihydrofolate reductase
MTASLILIAAVARNGAIGKDNRLLWHLPEDMKRFKQLTLGHAVLMGRKTWESLPEKFRPLPGRQNIVMTRDDAFCADGAVVVHSLAEAIAAADTTAVFVIGGAEIYAQSLAQADRLELTEVDDAPVGDVFFPTLDRELWQETIRERHPATATAPAYDFVSYVRR